MPSSRVDNLEVKYMKYLDAATRANTNFWNALNEVMPRVYMMGFWRDTMETLTEVDVSKGV